MYQWIIDILNMIDLLVLIYLIFKVKHENKLDSKIVKRLIWKVSMLEAELNKIRCNGEENEHTEPDNKNQTLAKYAILHDYIENK